MKLVIALLLPILLSTRQVKAIDLSIASPTVTGTGVILEASMSGTTNNYYLQGVMRSVESSKYFGETKNNQGEWIDYVSSPEKEYITSNYFITDVKDATWSGIINLRFKVDDPNYKGPGNYELKLRRYTGGSSSYASESNTLIITLDQPLPVASPSPSPTSSPSPTLGPSPAPSLSPSPTIKPSPSVDMESEFEGTVAGVTDIDLSAFGLSPPSPSPPTNHELTINKQRANTVIMIGAGLTLISCAGLFGYRRYLSSKKDAL